MLKTMPKVHLIYLQGFLLLSFFLSNTLGLQLTKSSKIINAKDSLIKVTQNIKYGLNATLEQKEYIQLLISELKVSRNKISNPASAFSTSISSDANKAKSILKGKWNLLYTDAPDVLSITKIPGVNLEYVGQEIDSDSKLITNIIYTEGPLSSTQEVYVGAKQVSSTRVELVFQGTKIQLRKIFGAESILGWNVQDIKPFEIQFKQADIEKNLRRSNRPTPAFELEYVDNNLRIQRTGEGYVFITSKEQSKNNDQQGVSVLSDDEGLGPWLTKKIGDRGMKWIGYASLIPYSLFIYRFLTGH